MKLVVLTHVKSEGPGLLDDFCRHHGIAVGELAVDRLEVFPELEPGTAVAIMGGPMNVYEEEKFPWLAEENRFIQGLLERDVPILGFCLGAQLIAKASGIPVIKNGAREIGYRPIHLTEAGREDELLSLLPSGLRVLHWHEDRVDLPGSIPALVTSADCPVQAFRLPGKRAWGLQFHIEVSPAMLERWFAKHRENLREGEAEPEKEMAASLELTPEIRRHADEIFTRFFELAGWSPEK